MWQINYIWETKHKTKCFILFRPHVDDDIFLPCELWALAWCTVRIVSGVPQSDHNYGTITLFCSPVTSPASPHSSSSLVCAPASQQARGPGPGQPSILRSSPSQPTWPPSTNITIFRKDFPRPSPAETAQCQWQRCRQHRRRVPSSSGAVTRPGGGRDPCQGRGDGDRGELQLGEQKISQRLPREWMVITASDNCSQVWR